MNDAHDLFLFHDDLTPAQQVALRDALASDAALADAFAQWQAVRAAIRADLDAAVPDRNLLVLYALDTSGRTDMLTDAEQDALADARPALEQALAAHPALTDVVGQMQRDADAFDAMWEATPAPRADRPAQANTRRSRSRWPWRVSVGAALVAFVAVVALLFQRDQALVTVQTAAGETQFIELADGSTVRLMEASTLTYADPEKATVFNRQVRLEGQAFFEVVKDQQGFSVETPTALTTVLGTSFGIQADDEMTEVTLATGRVALSPVGVQDQMVVLEPGQRSRVARGALPTTPEPVDLTDALDWTGLFVFRTASVEAIAERLSRHYGVAIAVAPELATQPVTGTFAKSRDLDDLLGVVAATLGAEVQPQPDGGYVLALAP